MFIFCSWSSQLCCWVCRCIVISHLPHNSQVKHVPNWAGLWCGCPSMFFLCQCGNDLRFKMLEFKNIFQMEFPPQSLLAALLIQIPPQLCLQRLTVSTVDALPPGAQHHDSECTTSNAWMKQTFLLSLLPAAGNTVIPSSCCAVFPKWKMGELGTLHKKWNSHPANIMIGQMTETECGSWKIFNVFSLREMWKACSEKNEPCCDKSAPLACPSFSMGGLLQISSCFHIMHVIFPSTLQCASLQHQVRGKVLTAAWCHERLILDDIASRLHNAFGMMNNHCLLYTSPSPRD